MGYTHYWKINKSFTDKSWEAFSNDVRSLFSSTKIPLSGSFGRKGTLPAVEPKWISFNGLEDDGHESCRITKSAIDFNFCKTARKPYDQIVVEVLKLAKKHNSSVELSSDGGEQVFN